MMHLLIRKKLSQFAGWRRPFRPVCFLCAIFFPD